MRWRSDEKTTVINKDEQKRVRASRLDYEPSSCVIWLVSQFEACLAYFQEIQKYLVTCLGIEGS